MVFSPHVSDGNTLDVRPLFPFAIEKAGAAQASRWRLINELPPSGQLTGDQIARLTTEFQSDGLRMFVNAQHEVRGAIASIDQYIPGGLRMYWDKFEIDQADFIELQKF